MLIVPRLIASAWGPPKSGKTWFAMSFPEPLYVIEIGETGVADYLYMNPTKRVIHRRLVVRSLAPQLGDHEKLLADFEEKFEEGVKEDVGTLVIDSTSRLWRSIRVVMTERAHEESERRKKNRADYELANDYMEQVVNIAAQNTRLNLVLVHRHRDKFAVDSEGKLQETGEQEARDYRGLENMVQVIVRTGHEAVFDPRTKERRQGFVHTIELCRFNKELEGMKVPMLDYGRLVERLFGGAA